MTTKIKYVLQVIIFLQIYAANDYALEKYNGFGAQVEKILVSRNSNRSNTSYKCCIFGLIEKMYFLDVVITWYHMSRYLKTFKSHLH